MAEFDSLRETLFDSEGQPSGWFFFFLLALVIFIICVYEIIETGALK